MLIHIYSNGKSMEDVTVTLHDALSLIESQQTLIEEPDNFIGFTVTDHPDAIIQFTRKTEEEWLIDIPTYKNDLYQGSLQSNIQHGKVIAVVSTFFTKNTELREAVIEQDYDRMKEFCAKKWGIAFTLRENP